MAIRNIFEYVRSRRDDVENLSVEQLQSEMDGEGDPLIVDLREIQERVDRGTIPGSVHAPRGMLEFWADPASPYYRDWFREDRRTIVFCAGGGRSVLAALSLQEMGFRNVAHLEPGFGGWEKAGGPIEDVRSTSRWVRRED